MIFISVAAFCEPFLEHTLKDAVAKAKYPSQLVFAVADQNPTYRKDELRLLCDPAQLRYVHIDPLDTRGVCWARSLVFSLYQGESYLLQIDSHMLFEPDWDEQLVTQWLELKSISSKPIISIYPHGFEFKDGKPEVSITVSPDSTLVMRPCPNANLNHENATFSFQTEHVFRREPILGCQIAAGFLFTAGYFIDEVPYDPRLYFLGEEQSIAVRAYTHGWDIFHPPHIPIFHLYKLPESSHISHHCHPDWEKQRDFKFTDLTKLANERLMDLVFERRDLGSFGLGKVRSLIDFARLSGIDYHNKKIIFPYQREPYWL